MKIEYGVVSESFKYQYGLYSTSPLTTAPKDMELFKEKSVSLVTGKGDWAAFQIMLKSDAEFIASVAGRPAFSPAGNLEVIRLGGHIAGMGSAEIKFSLVGLVEDDDRSFKSDILLHDEAIHVTKDRVQPVWTEIVIPGDTKAGVYKGEINIYSSYVFEDESKIGHVDFEIAVKDVEMPLPSNYRFYLDLWQHPSNIARKHEVRLWSHEHFEVLEHYIESLAQLGQKTASVVVSEIPWAGQACFRVKNYPSDLFEYNIVGIRKNTEGFFEYDFSHLKKYIDICFTHGISKEIEILGLICIWKFEAENYGKATVDYRDAIRLRYYDEKADCYKYMKHKKDVALYIKALEEFFISAGLIDKVRIVADEPHDKELYKEVLAFIKEAAPRFKYKTAINHVDFIEESKDKIDDFIIYLPAACAGRDKVEAVRKGISGRLMWYVCCEPAYPNTFICSPLLECRLIGWLSAFLKFDGFLRWNYTVWPEKPREKICYNYPLWPAGDTNFVYPGNDGTPLLTLRYKNMKRGIEDFELLCMLSEKCGDLRLVEDIYSIIIRSKDAEDFWGKGLRPDELYSLDFMDYCRAKEMLLDSIEKSSPRTS